MAPPNIPKALVNAIHRRLQEDQDAQTIAEALGLTVAAVQKEAEAVQAEKNASRVEAAAAKITPDSLHFTEEKLLHNISGGLTHFDLNKRLGLPANTIGEFFRTPETFSADRIRKNFIKPLSEAFPHKSGEIAIFEVITCILKSSPVSHFRKTQVRKPEEQARFRQAASLLLKDLREASGKSLADVQQQMPDRIEFKIVRDNLDRIEANDGKLPASALVSAIGKLIPVYENLAPGRTATYKPVLRVLAQRLGG